MDYIFKEWQEKLSKYESSIQKELADLRKCKAEVQQMRLDAVGKCKGRYIFDDERLILSAPEIIIGHVDQGGTLLEGKGSAVIVRGTQVDVHGVGESGQVAVHASSIRHIAEDPGSDGLEHVVYPLSEVVSQARNITLQSNNAEDMFTEPPVSTGTSGIRIHADEQLEIEAAVSSENKEKRLTALLSELKERNTDLEKQMMKHKLSFGKMVVSMEKLLAEKQILQADNDIVRASYMEVEKLNDEIDLLSFNLSQEVRSYADVISLLAETSRQIKCLNKEKAKIKKGDDFKQASTGASVSITGEHINIVSADGDGNLRDNAGAGLSLTANDMTIASVEADGTLKKDGCLSINTKYVGISTANCSDMKYDNDTGELTSATHTAEGGVIIKSKNITLESMDYETADKKLKEKALTTDGKVSVRAKTVEVSTENSTNVEVDDTGKKTKASYTAEGDVIVRSKTVTVEGIDYNLENGELKEKALAKDSSLTLRTEKMSLSATDSDGKATGSISLNAKDIGVKSMDIDKDSHADSEVAKDGKVTLSSEQLFVGAKGKSKKLQLVSEELGLFADKTLEVQQGDGQAALQLSGGNAALAGNKTEIYGDAEVKSELKAPKVTVDNLEAKTSFKSKNISDGIAVAAATSAKLSTKLKSEEK
jgi:hypothetical protein